MAGGVQIRVSIQDKEVQARFAELLRRGRDLHTALDEIGSMLLASTQQRFEAERDPEGNPWAPLAIATTKKKVGKGKDAPRRGARNILRVSGLLYQSLTHLATNKEVRVGTNRKKYPALQQLGGKPGMAPGPAAVPARPFLGISQADEQEIGAILLDHLEG